MYINILALITKKFEQLTDAQRLELLKEKYPLSIIEKMEESECLYLEEGIVRMHISKTGKLVYSEYVSCSRF